MGFRGTGRRWGWGACALLCVLPGVGQGRSRFDAGAAFLRAELAWQALEAVPEGERTKADFDRALDAYRAVYHGAPGDAHAAEAVYDVAGLLAEEGRWARDGGLLRASVAQYEFLRRQYPGSSWRVPALLREGDIEAVDLGDVASGRARWEQLVEQYPGSTSAGEARARLADAGMGGAGRADGGTVVAAVAPGQAVDVTGLPGSGQRNASNGGGAAADGREAVAGAAAGGAADVVSGPAPTVFRGGAAKRAGPIAAVTGIRYWSTASYTRVAIDLGDEVEYQAVRVTGPDRIYFDLHGTRLAAELVGKTFAVTDDGFLKRIRAAQFRNDMTRVVLDVNDVTEYSAFLLPNPYRLIIDIHGAKRGAGAAAGQTVSSAGEGVGTAAPVVRAAAAGADVAGGVEAPAAAAPAPATARVVTPTVARPVPNTVAVPTAGAASEVVRKVSEQPGRMEATVVPTTGPVAEVVRPGRREVGSAGQAQAGQVGAGSAGSAGAAGSLDGTVVGGAPAAGGAGAGAASGKKGRKRGATAADGRVVGVAPAVASTPGAPARAAVPTADGQTSLVRALGLKIGRIVIDAGHGGHDSGTLGADGIEEKDVVLDVALRVGKLLHDRLGAEVIFTRSDDTFIPLETRTAIANKAQADLFLSIHANSSSDATARGVETYYLNFTTDPTALNVAARENAVSDQSVGQLSDLVKKIALKDKIAESREFAGDVEGSLFAGLEKGNAGLKDRGVKKAPFVVLIGANMPSVLAEISFVTNPRDARELRDPAYRERVAESLYRGVAKYEAGLSGGQAPPRVGDGVAQVGTRSGR